MSFVTQEDVFKSVEPVLRDVFVEFGCSKRVTETFPRIPYANVQKYGSDKPDFAYPIEMQDVTPPLTVPISNFCQYDYQRRKGAGLGDTGKTGGSGLCDR